MEKVWPGPAPDASIWHLLTSAVRRGPRRCHQSCLGWPRLVVSLSIFYIHFVTHPTNCYCRTIEVLTNCKDSPWCPHVVIIWRGDPDWGPGDWLGPRAASSLQLVPLGAPGPSNISAQELILNRSHYSYLSAPSLPSLYCTTWSGCWTRKPYQPFSLVPGIIKFIFISTVCLKKTLSSKKYLPLACSHTGHRGIVLSGEARWRLVQTVRSVWSDVLVYQQD